VELYAWMGKPLKDHLEDTLKAAQVLASRQGIKLDQEAEKAIWLHAAGKAHPAFQACLLSFGEFFNPAPLSAAFVLQATGNRSYAEAVLSQYTSLAEGRELEREVRFWGERLEEVPFSDPSITAKIREVPPPPRGPEAWLEKRLFYSLLLAADLYATLLEREWEFLPLQVDLEQVDKYAITQRSRPGAPWRIALRREVQARAEKIEGPGVYTLSLPTGGGKTLMGLEAAMMAAVKTDAPSLVYVLPSQTPIEENANVARIMFKKFFFLGEDHHPPVGPPLEGVPFSLSFRRQFFSFWYHWQEPVMVTGLERFIELLYSPLAQEALSFYRLYGAVVLLEEGWCLPTPQGENLFSFLSSLAEKMNMTFILPCPWPWGEEGIAEIGPGPHVFPGDRYQVDWDPVPLEEGELLSFLESHLALGRGRSLIILNHPGKALSLWLALEKKGLNPSLLTPWMAPIHRRAVVQEIRQNRRDQPVCLVATPMGEGVDLDFSLVFRELAPLPRLLWAAGRCNRHGAKERGGIFIRDLQGRSLYPRDALEKTRRALGEARTFLERELVTLLGLYTPGPEDRAYPEEIPQATLILPYGERQRDWDILTGRAAPSRGMELLHLKRSAYRRFATQALSLPEVWLREWSERMPGGVTEVMPGLWFLEEGALGKVYSPRWGFLPPEGER